jgi:protocatechuate 3,4-dioxygenase beta subunit
MSGSHVLRCLAIATLVVSGAAWAELGAQAPRTPNPRAVAPRDPNGATGGVAGRIVSADEGRPIRHAQVRAERGAGERPDEPSVTLTDEDGRYQLSALPTGLWTLTVSKAGYVRTVSGQKRSASPSTLRITANEITSFDAALVRGAAISGAVIDESGDPVAGVAVQALRARFVDGARRLTEVATDQTDDTGAFRLHSLPAGEYYVAARMRVASPEDAGLTSDALPTFYPGTSSIGEARRVSVGSGDDRGGVSFAVLPASPVRISGTIVDSTGRSVDEAPVELIDPTDGTVVAHPFGNFGLTHDGGRYTFLNVSPGAYLVSVLVDRPNSSYEEKALVPVTVSGGDVADVTVRTAPAGSVTGSVLAAADTPLPRGWRAQLWAKSGYGGPLRTTSLAANQPFVLSGAFGPTSFGVANLPGGWTLQRIEINGADVTDETVDITPGARTTARVVVTKTNAQLTGIVTADDKPVVDIPVVVFATEPTKWTVPSRFVNVTRTDAQGRFSITGLPPSDYLAIASDDVDDDDYLDAEVLLRLRSRSTPVTLVEGSPTSLRLALGTKR